MISFFIAAVAITSVDEYPHAVINQQRGPNGKIFGSQFIQYGTNQMRSVQETKVRTFSVWDEQLVNKSFIVWPQ